jgi:hypothetical protein
MSKSGKHPPALPGKRRVDPMTVIVRPTSFTPEVLKSSGDVMSAAGTGLIVPKSTRGDLFGGSPFETEPSTSTPSPQVPEHSGPKFRKNKKRPQMVPSVVAGSSAIMDHIHDNTVGKDLRHQREQEALERAAAANTTTALPVAVAVTKKPVRKKKASSALNCRALQVLASRLQAWTGVGAGRAWRLLNPVSTALAKHLLRKRTVYRMLV